jgi:hypothetical protein
MKTFLSILMTLVAMLLPISAFAETIPGGSALPCADATAFTPIYAEDGSVAYWNNPTCTSPDGGAVWVQPEIDEELTDD